MEQLQQTIASMEAAGIPTDAITTSISNYIKSNRINLSELSRTTGIGYKQLYASLGDKNRNRELRAWELFRICEALKISPVSFDPI